MKPKSAKAKGKRLQNWTQELILKLFPLHPDDVRSTTMGDTGEDVKLSPAARKWLPFQIECKNRRRMAIFRDYEQAKEHGEHNPMLVVKEDQSVPLVVVDAEWFFNYIRKTTKE